MALSTFLLWGCNLLGGGVDAAGIITSHFTLVTLDASGLSDGRVSADESVNPSSFLATARDKIGRAPTSVDLLRVRLSAGNGVDGVAAWGDVVSGPISVTLIPDSGSPLEVATAALPASGLEPIEARVTTDRDSLDLAPDVAAGRFSVSVAAASDRAAEPDFTLPVRVELEFVAF
jgi:hypothetical protein